MFKESLLNLFGNHRQVNTVVGCNSKAVDFAVVEDLDQFDGVFVLVHHNLDVFQEG